jgi:hypothetical protein
LKGFVSVIGMNSTLPNLVSQLRNGTFAERSPGKQSVALFDLSKPAACSK